jgi:hypothetical protein
MHTMTKQPVIEHRRRPGSQNGLSETDRKFLSALRNADPEVRAVAVAMLEAHAKLKDAVRPISEVAHA